MPTTVPTGACSSTLVFDNVKSNGWKFPCGSGSGCGCGSGWGSGSGCGSGSIWSRIARSICSWNDESLNY